MEVLKNILIFLVLAIGVIFGLAATASSFGQLGPLLALFAIAIGFATMLCKVNGFDKAAFVLAVIYLLISLIGSVNWLMVGGLDLLVSLIIAVPCHFLLAGSMHFAGSAGES